MVIDPCFGIARNAPVGVVIASWSGRLSRMYHWDLETDTFTPGQFLKASASLLEISPDGKYVVYFAEAHHKREQGYVAISHIPYFTAMLFQTQFYLGGRYAEFAEDGSLDILTMPSDYSWVKDRENFVKDRIDPNCPFKIRIYKNSEYWPKHLAQKLHEPNWSEYLEDKPRNRLIYRNDNRIEILNTDREFRTLRSFPEEKFQEVVPPDWAKVW